MPFCAAVIVVVPVATPVAMPAALIVAAGIFEEAQVTLFVRFWVVWLLNVPVAVKDWVVPAAIDVVAGVTAIETRTAAVTARFTPGEVIPFCAAVIVVEPAATPVATPAALIVAVGKLEDVHVTLFVKFWLVWLLKVPVAVYVWVVPVVMDAVAGVTAMETRTAGVTVSVTPGEVIAPCAAVIVVFPAAIPVATPDELIVAAGALEEFQVTLFVKFCVVWLLKVPVAV
jgi:hypothetical protein